MGGYAWRIASLKVSNICALVVKPPLDTELLVSLIDEIALNGHEPAKYVAELLKHEIVFVGQGFPLERAFFCGTNPRGVCHGVNRWESNGLVLMIRLS